MFLLPLLVVTIVAVGAYRLLHRHAHVASDAGRAGVGAIRAPMWPHSLSGRLGIGAMALELVNVTLVNVVQVPYLGWALVLAALGLTASARFAERDRAASVLVVLVVSAIAIAAALAFLVGERFTG